LPAALDFSASNPDWLEKPWWQARQLDAMIGWTDCQAVALTRRRP